MPSVDENRYYLYEKKILKWLGNKNTNINHKTKIFMEENSKLNDEIENVIKTINTK